MASNSFPTAVKCEPIYTIDGALYRRVSHAEGQRDPNAIRAMLPAANGEHQVKWFAPFALPVVSEESAS